MRRIKTLITSILAILLFSSPVLAARTDMVDVSNHNGYMTVDNWTQMRNQYGVKAMVTKLTEGTYYQDPTAQTAISTARQSGLYVNGYYFCRYSNIEQAKAEAQYAVNYARQIGLPTNAVVVADIEAKEQQSIPMSTNDLAISAMQQIVEQAGYRFCVYSMSSWGDVHISWKNIKWIANYPYNLNQDKFTAGYAWQFRSDQTFNGSYGKFDVSQLYNDFFTGGQNKNAVISNADTHDVSKNTGQQENQMASDNNTATNEDYAQNGTFTANTTLNIRTAPSTSARIVGSYAPGESLIYDHVYIRDGYAWARYMSYSGSYHYVAMGKMGGQEYGTRSTNVKRSYTVQSGDTVSSIANKLGVSYATIANQFANPNLIYPGNVVYY